MDLSTIKRDVLQELSIREYYNQQEILRLVYLQNEISHKDRVDQICETLRENVSLRESIKLMNYFFPEKQATPPSESPAEQPAK